jgi:hypothetical protein
MNYQVTEVDETVLSHNLDANLAAARNGSPPDIPLANHLLMRPVIPARVWTARRRMRSRSMGALLHLGQVKQIRPNPNDPNQ